MKNKHEQSPDVDSNKFLYLKNKVLQCVDKFKKHNLPIDKPKGAEWNNSSILCSKEVTAREELNTLSYSPYKEVDQLNFLLADNFMSNLYDTYFQFLDNIEKIATYSISRMQIPQFLNDIGYNTQDYGIVTTYKINEIDKSDVCLSGVGQLVHNFGFFIIKKDEIPYVSFDKSEDKKLHLLQEGCALSANIDSFKDWHKPSFDLKIAAKMHIHTKESLQGVVYVRVKDEWSEQEILEITIEKTLQDLFNV